MDRGIHANLITFVTLLLANNCFHLNDIITYIIRPILSIYAAPEAMQNSPLAFDFVNSLILHLFVSDYREGVAEVGMDTPILLPQFVQHCLSAKCRDLTLGYAFMLLKDLVKMNQLRSAGSKSEALLVHSNTPANEVGLNKVRLLTVLCFFLHLAAS